LPGSEREYRWYLKYPSIIIEKLYKIWVCHRRQIEKRNHWFATGGSFFKLNDPSVFFSI
jgi:hypothetical protein